MDQDERRIAFLKVLIAAAWADERLSPPEIRTLSYYLQRLRISAEEYETLRPLLEQPLTPEEARQLVEQQLRLLAGTEEQRTLIAAVEDLLASDDELLPAEEEFLRQVRRMTHDPPTAQVFVARLKTLWSGAAPLKREEPGHSLMDVFIRQRLLQYFRGRLALARARGGLPTDTEEQIDDRDLYRLVIWAGLLGRVALADRGLRPPEKDQLVDIIKHTGPVPEADLEVVADGSLDGSLDGIELVTLVQEFLRLAEPQDIEMLLDSLFLVAAADGRLMQVEADVIHEIARGAGFSEQAFRASLERCKRRMTSGWN